MNSDELFPAEAVQMDSPKLAWLKKHGLETQRNEFAGEFSEEWDDGETPAWVCRVVKDSADMSSYRPREIAGGKTEEEACAELALIRGIPLWNEE